MYFYGDTIFFTSSMKHARHTHNNNNIILLFVSNVIAFSVVYLSCDIITFIYIDITFSGNRYCVSQKYYYVVVYV